MRAVYAQLARHRLAMPLSIGLETVAGMMYGREILGSEGVDAAYFGADDYVIDLRGIRTEHRTEVPCSRSFVAMAAWSTTSGW